MSVMLEGQPEHELAQPNGIIERRINPDTGLLAADCNSQNTLREYFLYESQPARESDSVCLSRRPAAGGSQPLPGAGNSGSLFP
jgi:membrane carboxypeptidase/penicillin-binding protein